LRNQTKLQRCALDDPHQLVDLERQPEDPVTEVLAEAADTGYSMAEVLIAFNLVCDRQHDALSEYRDV